MPEGYRSVSLFQPGGFRTKAEFPLSEGFRSKTECQEDDSTRGERLGKMVKILEPSNARMSQDNFRGIDVRVGSAAS
jgi:hypothetical protein